MTIAVLTPPPAAPPVGPQPYRWTVAEFDALGDRGLFDGRRAMLVRGHILEQGPMNHPHAIALELVDAAVRAVFAAGWRVRGQLPLRLSADTSVFPDVAIVPGTARGATAHPTTASLVVEVADTTLVFDLTTKAELYAAAGIPEYWVLDLDGRRLVVLRDPAPLPPGGHVYRSSRSLGPADAVSPLAAPAATVRVADLLP